jgi:hypothetical protein
MDLEAFFELQLRRVRMGSATYSVKSGDAPHCEPLRPRQGARFRCACGRVRPGDRARCRHCAGLGRQISRRENSS